MTFTVTLSLPTNVSVTVAFATANNTAVSPSDYTATSGTLTFVAGDTSETIAVTVPAAVCDFESTETFFVNLSSPTNAVIGDGQGQGTILNNSDPCD